MVLCVFLSCWVLLLVSFRRVFWVLILISDGALQSNKMLLRGCMSVSFLDGTCNAFSKQCPACNAVNLHLSMFFYVPMTHDSKKTMVPSPTEQLIFACKPTHCKPYILAAVWRAGCQSIGICFKKWRRNNKNGFKKKSGLHPHQNLPVSTLMKFPWKFRNRSSPDSPFSFWWAIWSSEIQSSSAAEPGQLKKKTANLQQRGVSKNSASGGLTNPNFPNYVFVSII